MVDRTDGLTYQTGQGYSALDAQSTRDRLDGYAVVSGLGVSPGGSLSVDVTAGEAIVGTDTNGDTITVSPGSAQTVSLAAADSANPRKDTVWIDDTGTAQVATGTAESALPEGNSRFNTFQPEPPFPGGDGTILAEVYVAAGASSLTSADVRDRRQPAQIVGEEIQTATANHDSVSTDELNNADYYVSTDDDLVQVATDAPAGSTIAILPGEHEAEGVPFRHEFVAYPGSTLSLPTSPTNHLFVADTDAVLNGEGVQNLTLDGGGTTTYDGLHLDDATRYEDGLIQNADVVGFRRGYSGTANDRQPNIYGSRFRNCEIGVYVNSNHPNLTNVDIRDCTTGLGGDTFDLIVTSTKFVRNDYGVRPLDGGTINSTYFYGCTFFQNSEVGADLDSRCSIIGGQLTPPDTPGTATGVELAEGSLITGVLLRQSTGNEFGDTAIRAEGSSISGNQFYYLAGNLVDASRSVSITGNSFTACLDTHIKLTGPTVSITGNTVHIEGEATAQFAVSDANSDTWQPTINSNSVVINPGVVLDNPLVEINDDLGFGFVMQGNSFYGYSGTSGSEYIGGDAEAAIIKNNLTRRLTQGTLSTDADTINKDNIELS